MRPEELEELKKAVAQLNRMRWSEPFQTVVEAAPALIAEVERLTAENERLRKTGIAALHLFEAQQHLHNAEMMDSTPPALQSGGSNGK